MKKKPKKFGEYICPHGKLVPTVPAKYNYNRGSKSTVSGSYCKNNCSLYRKMECKLFSR